MNAPSVLVAGVGNIFLGDDAFGVEVARLLATRDLGAHVRVVDMGIRAFDLMLALSDGCDAAIIIDAVRRGCPAGTILVIDPESGAKADGPHASIEPHSMDVTSLLRSLGTERRCRRVVLVGCDCGPDENGDPLNMSDAVRAAIPTAADVVEQVLGSIGGPVVAADAAEGRT